MANCIGLELGDGGVDVAHRVPSRDKDKPNVVVRFATRTSRDSFLSAAKKTRLNMSHHPSYLNEHLCLENKILFHKAREAHAAKKMEICVDIPGPNFMRKAENSTVVHIQSEDDLQKIV